MRWTNEQLQAYEARRNAKFERWNKQSGAPATDVNEQMNERGLHGQIYSECRRRGWIAFHGSMADRSHRTLGEPDFQILADSGRLFLVECKTKTGKLTIEQQAMIAHTKKLGHEIHVVRSFDEFLKLL